MVGGQKPDFQVSVRFVDSVLFHSDASQELLLANLLSVAGQAHVVRVILVTAIIDAC